MTRLSRELSETPREEPARWSWAGLCAASFFLAEVDGVTMPFVNTYLLERGWRYDVLGTLAAAAGAVSLLVNLPGGHLIDRARRRRLMLASTSLLAGGCFALLPLVPATPIAVGVLLLAAALGRPFFGLLTNALTLSLAGHDGVDRAVGIKEAWNHAGNIAAAVTAMLLVLWFPVTSVFFAVAAASLLAAARLP